MIAGKLDDHVISVEDNHTGLVFHFAVGNSKGLRYLGVQSDPPQSTPPSVSPAALMAADKAARIFAKASGWL